MTTMKGPVICMQRSALPVLEGESAASKVAPETSLSVTVTMVPLLSGSFKTRLFNVKVTPVTPEKQFSNRYQIGDRMTGHRGFSGGIDCIYHLFLTGAVKIAIKF